MYLISEARQQLRYTQLHTNVHRDVSMYECALLTLFVLLHWCHKLKKNKCTQNTWTHTQTQAPSWVHWDTWRVEGDKHTLYLTYLYVCALYMYVMCTIHPHATHRHVTHTIACMSVHAYVHIFVHTYVQTCMGMCVTLFVCNWGKGRGNRWHSQPSSSAS